MRKRAYAARTSIAGPHESRPGKRAGPTTVSAVTVTIAVGGGALGPAVKRRTRAGVDAAR